MTLILVFLGVIQGLLFFFFKIRKNFIDNNNNNNFFFELKLFTRNEIFSLCFGSIILSFQDHIFGVNVKLKIVIKFEENFLSPSDKKDRIMDRI